MILHKKQIVISLVVMITLLVAGSIFGWLTSRSLEKSDSILTKTHRLKEAELEVRRQEKNLLIRGFLQEEFNNWQKAKKNLAEILADLNSLEALDSLDILEMDEHLSRRNEISVDFIKNLESGILTQDQKNQFDNEFKKIGRQTIDVIDRIVEKKQIESGNLQSRFNIIIIVLSIFFIVMVTGFSYYLIRQI